MNQTETKQQRNRIFGSGSAKKSLNSNEKVNKSLRKKWKKGSNYLNISDFCTQPNIMGTRLLETNVDDICTELLTASSNVHLMTQKNSTVKKQSGDDHLINLTQFAPVLNKRSGTNKVFNFKSSNNTMSDLMDRFIPGRMKENLQAKFEAVSLNTVEYLKTQENV